ncbi:amino acid ABC transporter substrate-binding protein, PAAT family [Arboricoccus pini]|uniref:Amino acid ABC transporter substrate-binding protein, PAAT family n=1 Tax=Arboricoccus pini TaxID=1963835 RepID=A0A212RWT4_9PROT|nr:ABC transporter substrate-binding protein [Arboricoccus pini]SNB77060.1 amino acid ABC transporter substrate-binding protein, PAAT family [Arboricoccus pini]
MKLVVATCAAVLALALNTVSPLQAKEWKTVRVGLEGDYPPFSSVGPDGKIVGWEVDYMNLLCEHMKVKCTPVQQDFDGMIPALQAPKFDAIMASMSITDVRKKQIAFSVSYYNTPTRFVAKKGANIEISPAGLKGKKIGVQRSTIQDNYLTDNYASVAEIVRYGSQDDMFLDLVAGRLDLGLGDSLQISDGFIKTDRGKDFEMIGPNLTDSKWFGDGVGVGLRKQDDDLKKMFDTAIAETLKDGSYQALEKKYFDIDIYGG